MQETLDALEAHSVGRGEEAGGGAVAVGGDQVCDLALAKGLVQTPRPLRARFWGTRGASEGRSVATPQVNGLR
jgi:hypothetical protein